MDGTIRAKKRVVVKILKHIKQKKTGHNKKAQRLKRLNTLLEGSVVLFSTITSSTIVITFVSLNPLVLILSGVFTGLTTLASGIKKTMNLDSRIEQHRNAHNRLLDLYREVEISMVRNGFTSTDIDALLTDIHHRMSMIAETSPSIGALSSISVNGDDREYIENMFIIEESPLAPHRSIETILE